MATKALNLSSSGLLLDRHDLQDLILQGRSKEEVNDLVLLEINKQYQSDLGTSSTNKMQKRQIRTQVDNTNLSEDRRVKSSSGRS